MLDEVGSSDDFCNSTASAFGSPILNRSRWILAQSGQPSCNDSSRRRASEREGRQQCQRRILMPKKRAPRRPIPKNLVNLSFGKLLEIIHCRLAARLLIRESYSGNGPDYRKLRVRPCPDRAGVASSSTCSPLDRRRYRYSASRSRACFLGSWQLNVGLHVRTEVLKSLGFSPLI